MTVLIYFLIYAALFAVMMRFGCGAHVMGHGGHGKSDEDPMKASTAALGIAKDPVCGMNVDTATARTTTHAGTAYYFCSARCQERFAASPESYPRSGVKAPEEMEKTHGHHQH